MPIPGKTVPTLDSTPYADGLVSVIFPALAYNPKKPSLDSRKFLVCTGVIDEFLAGWLLDSLDSVASVEFVVAFAACAFGALFWLCVLAFDALGAACASADDAKRAQNILKTREISKSFILSPLVAFVA